jgi:hypothetical protein
MLTFKIENKKLEKEFSRLVDVFGSKEKAFEEMIISTNFLLAEQSYPELVDLLSEEFRKRGKFDGMDREQILNKLRKAREEIGKEFYDNIVGH